MRKNHQRRLGGASAAPVRFILAAILLVGFGVSPAAAQAAQPRPEYPRPELVRSEWLNLNGAWDFAFDPGASGEARGMAGGEGFDRKIVVPFAFESPLSGIGLLDFAETVWYKRAFDLPAAWQGRRVLLRFEAVDYEATVWVNGRKAGSHQGGYTPFALDITEGLKPAGNLLVVRAVDRTRSGAQPVGKQSDRFASYGCVYRRTTGIWQTVWLEPLPDVHIERIKASSDVDNAEVNLHVYMNKDPDGGRVAARISFGGKPVASLSKSAGRIVRFTVKIPNPALWGVRSPNLYDLDIVYEKDGRAADRAASYFGLRKFEVRGRKFYLNNKPLFLRTVLDQGFYRDGIYTAPGDEALKRDVEMGLAFGFDGARLHQRVFERRFLYWADKLGYLVWGEFADWGLDLSRPEAYLTFAREWTEAVERDLNHPSLIGWCPFNERWGAQYPGIIAGIFKLTKLLDPSRPAIDASGGFHAVSPDVYDAHDYDQDPVKFKERYAGLLAEPARIYVNGGTERNAPYAGQPYFLSEYGGIWWNPGQKDDKAWGYGERPRGLEEFLERYRKLTDVLLDNPAVAGFCYTQLYDIEQEVNGLASFDRVPKHDPVYFFKINQRRAAVEKNPEY